MMVSYPVLPLPRSLCGWTTVGVNVFGGCPHAEFNALVTNESRRPRDQRPDLQLSLAAKRTAKGRRAVRAKKPPFEHEPRSPLLIKQPDRIPRLVASDDLAKVPLCGLFCYVQGPRDLNALANSRRGLPLD